MDPVMDKENIADGLLAPLDQKPTASPTKKALKKSRSSDIGPGSLSNKTLKVDFGNRRKSAFPAIKSILPAADDAAKRKADRRKSLANRRVSFAPEATLHTWDVVEYIKDATTSSASSDNTRRASSITEVSEPPTPGSTARDNDGDAATDRPVTPPEQADADPVRSTPESQRKVHQKQRRRSSSGPDLDGQNGFSSSPYNDQSPLASDPVEVHHNDSDDSASGDDDVSVTMDLDDMTGQSVASVASATTEESTSSSARLDEALRQAARHAGAQEVVPADDGDMTMDMVTDEVTNAFRPWVQKSADVSYPVLPSFEDKENDDPFRSEPQPRSQQMNQHDLSAIEEDTQEMSMDITRAMGGILRPAPSSTQQAQMPTEDQENLVPGGNRGLKRRRSTALGMEDAQSHGSPAKRPAPRRQSLRRRRSSAVHNLLDDGTMEFTMAVGGIRSAKQGDEKLEEDTAALGDATMDFTVAVGGLQGGKFLAAPAADLHEEDANEDMSMELTTTLDKTIVVNNSKRPAANLPSFPAASKQPDDEIEAEDTEGSSMELTQTIDRTIIVQQPIQRIENSNEAAIATEESIGLQNTPAKSPVAPQPNLLQTPDATMKPASPERKPLSPIKSSRPVNRRSLAAKTVPEIVAEFEAHPGKENAQPSTPQIDSIKRRSSIHFSPIQDRAVDTPVKEASQPAPAPEDLISLPAVEEEHTKSLSLADSIRMMSTPKKQSHASPAKRLAAMTPDKRVTPKRISSPKKISSPQKNLKPNKKQVVLQEAPKVQRVSAEDDIAEGADRITLQDFLALTNIKFMDLTTTKRRHTGYPGADAKTMAEEDDTPAEPPTLENNVGVAIGVVPLLSMYQHCCHEMKNYINGGRAAIKTLEAEAYESQPPLFREYMGATNDVQAIMDNQFKNMKTNARLQSKSGWHTWRSQLLNDLRQGLEQTGAELERDEENLAAQEAILQRVLPELEVEESELGSTLASLQRRKAESESEDRELLEHSRDQLLEIEEALSAQRQQVEQLQRSLHETTERCELAKEQKEELFAEIKEAERVREECRGWSVKEVAVAKDSLLALETEHGWKLSSAESAPDTIALTYRSDLRLSICPRAFRPSICSDEANNAPISLIYVGDNDDSVSAAKQRPLTDSKRFFLQLLRAHLHCIPQSQVTMRSVLDTISAGWDAATSVADAIRRLSQICMVDEQILSDERLAVDAIILLPVVQTKVRARFEISATCAVPAGNVDTDIKVEARVVYGEKYDEKKMAEFLSQFVSSSLEKSCGKSWAEGVEDLKVKLIRRGPKGQRL